jgi:hypothetical protein
MVVEKEDREINNKKRTDPGATEPPSAAQKKC